MLKYILIVALGAISYGMLSSFVKISYSQGYNAGEITFAQAFLGALFLWFVVISKSLKTKKWNLIGGWKLIVAGTSMGVSAYLYYLSVSYIPASLAIVLLMQVTWMSILLEWIVSRKKPSKKQILSTIIIILGTILAGNLMMQQHFNFSITGIVIALLSALAYAFYIIFTSKLGNELPLFEKSALMTTGSAIMILCINLKSISASTHLDFGLLKWGLFLAFFGTIIPPICFTKGMPKIGATLSSILLTLELPVAIFCANLILGEKITPIQIVGILIMLGAIIYLNLEKKQNTKTEILNH